MSLLFGILKNNAIRKKADKIFASTDAIVLQLNLHSINHYYSYRQLLIKKSIIVRLKP